MQYRRISHPRSRSIRVRVMPDGEVRVTAPRFVREGEIERFLVSAQGWIEKQQQTRKQACQHDGMYVLGEKYQLIVESDGAAGVHVNHELRVIRVVPVANTKESVRRAIERWVRSQAEQHITARAHDLASRMNLSFSTLKFRKQRSRWGSCSSRKTLSLNLYLIHALPEVIDYVIIHELAHLVHMNHSLAFWRLVAQHDPLYKAHRRWLNRHGTLIQYTHA